MSEIDINALHPVREQLMAGSEHARRVAIAGGTTSMILGVLAWGGMQLTPEKPYYYYDPGTFTKLVGDILYYGPHILGWTGAASWAASSLTASSGLTKRLIAAFIGPDSTFSPGKSISNSKVPDMVRSLPLFPYKLAELTGRSKMHLGVLTKAGNTTHALWGHETSNGNDWSLKTAIYREDGGHNYGHVSEQYVPEKATLQSSGVQIRLTELPRYQFGVEVDDDQDFVERGMMKSATIIPIVHPSKLDTSRSDFYHEISDLCDAVNAEPTSVLDAFHKAFNEITSIKEGDEHDRFERASQIFYQNVLTFIRINDAYSSLGDDEQEYVKRSMRELLVIVPFGSLAFTSPECMRQALTAQEQGNLRDMLQPTFDQMQKRAHHLAIVAEETTTRTTLVTTYINGKPHISPSIEIVPTPEAIEAEDELSSLNPQIRSVQQMLVASGVTFE